MQHPKVQQAVVLFNKIVEIFQTKHIRHYALPIRERVELLQNRLGQLEKVKLLDKASSDLGDAITRATSHLITIDNRLCGQGGGFTTGHLSDTSLILSDKDVDGVRTTRIASIHPSFLHQGYFYLDQVLRIVTSIYLVHAIYK
jgi:hypothetical protein